MPERMFWMPQDMPERISECMPDRVPERMSEDMPDRMPERKSERMSEDMPDRMSEDMPDRMSEDMLDMRDRWGGREKMCQIECRKECQKDVSVDVSDKIYVKSFISLLMPTAWWLRVCKNICCSLVSFGQVAYLDISFQSCGVCSYICHGGDHSKWSNLVYYELPHVIHACSHDVSAPTKIAASKPQNVMGWWSEHGFIFWVGMFYWCNVVKTIVYHPPNHHK